MDQPDKDLIKIFRVLGNPVRLAVYKVILEKACECDMEEKEKEHDNCVSSISEKLNLPQPTVSNHVKELMNAGLIENQKRGKNSYLFGTSDAAALLESFGNFVTKEVNGVPH